MSPFGSFCLGGLGEAAAEELAVLVFFEIVDGPGAEAICSDVLRCIGADAGAGGFELPFSRATAGASLLTVGDGGTEVWPSSRCSLACCC